uniref:Perforin 1 (Pore forming protein) n=1 Tax=Nothobranchius furzeri TaxID=105023 RepID=A0A8C6K7P8_NOTFU
MFLLTFSTCASLLLVFPPCTHQLCRYETSTQCEEAEFAPGSNLAGEGFDITKMERKGAFVLDMNKWKRKDKSCMLCINPYLDNKKQKLPLSVVDWRAKQSCSAKVSSKLYKSSEALVRSSSSSVENNWKLGLNFQTLKTGASLMLAGTNSKLADYSMEKTKSDKFSFASVSMSCEYYSYRVSGSPKLHQEFGKAAKRLPKVYSSETKQHFYKLIDTFGTHYITKVKLGGDVHSVTSIRQCQASLQGLSAEEVQMCLAVEASASFRATITTESKHCKKDIQKSDSKAAFSNLFNDRCGTVFLTHSVGGHTTEPDLLFSADKSPSAYKEWLSTIPQNPDIVSYSLDSLHELLPADTKTRQNLRSAVTHYILEKGLWKNCSESCQTGRAAGLWGDWFTSTDGFVKVFFNKIEHRTHVITNNNNPHWDMVIDLGDQDLSSVNKVKFEVWDQDSGWDDDLLGACEKVLTAGVKQDLCYLNRGQLFYKLEALFNELISYSETIQCICDDK